MTCIQQQLLLMHTRGIDPIAFDTRHRILFCRGCGKVTDKHLALSQLRRCPTCNEYRKPLSEAITNKNEAGVCLCGHHSLISTSGNVAYPFCEYYDDEDGNEADGPDIEGSSAVPQAPSRYRGATLLACGHGTGSRATLPYYEEHSGHYRAAVEHDAVNQPDESDVPSRHNYIPSTELLELQRPIEPWDLDALRASTGQGWQELRRVFHETWDVPLRPGTPDAPPASPITEADNEQCMTCTLPVTNDFVAWVQSGDVQWCRVCGKVDMPFDEHDPDFEAYTTDSFPPDWNQFCHCRCFCRQQAELDAGSDIEEGGSSSEGSGSSTDHSSAATASTEVSQSAAEESTGSRPQNAQHIGYVSIRGQTAEAIEVREEQRRFVEREFRIQTALVSEGRADGEREAAAAAELVYIEADQQEQPRSQIMEHLPRDASAVTRLQLLCNAYRIEHSIENLNRIPNVRGEAGNRLQGFLCTFEVYFATAGADDTSTLLRFYGGRMCRAMDIILNEYNRRVETNARQLVDRQARRRARHNQRLILARYQAVIAVAMGRRRSPRTLQPRLSEE